MYLFLDQLKKIELLLSASKAIVQLQIHDICLHSLEYDVLCVGREDIRPMILVHPD